MSSTSKKITAICLFLIITIGALVRFNNSYLNMRFLNDESAIMSSVQRLNQGLLTRDLSLFPLKGPAAETFTSGYGSLLHHGAFFIYLIYLPALITNFHPWGPTFFVIVLNILAIYFIYKCGEDLFGRVGGLIAALLLATSFFATVYSIWMWNPNLIVFFTILTIFSFLKITKGKLKYWPVFAFAAASTTQMHILGYVFILITFIPLLLFVRYPKGKLLILTVIGFLLPLGPEILSEVISGLEFSKNLSSLLYNHSADYFDFSVFKNLVNIVTNSLLGLKVDQLFLFFTLLVIGIILAIATRFKSIKITTVKSIYFNNIYTFLFISGSIATIAVTLFSRKHLERGPTHPLLVCLPLFLLFFSLILKHLLLNKIVFPIAIILISMYLYSNLTMIITNVWSGRSPNFQDQLRLIEYLEFKTEISGVAIDEETILYALPWIATNYTKSNNINFVSVDSNPEYLVVNSYSSKVKNNTGCPSRVLEKNFGSLSLYKCI